MHPCSTMEKLVRLPQDRSCILHDPRYTFLTLSYFYPVPVGKPPDWATKEDLNII